MRYRSTVLLPLIALAFVGAGCGGGGSVGGSVNSNKPTPTPIVANCDGHWTGGHKSSTRGTEAMCNTTVLDWTVANGQLTGTVTPKPGRTFPIKASVTSDCKIVNGVTTAQGYTVSFDGSLSGTTGGGNYDVQYGCAGTYTLTKQAR